LGDPVSLAARLESQTKGYGVLMIISENTARLVKDSFPLWELGKKIISEARKAKEEW
jgi:class 3 adenylate cyclase